MQWPYPRHDTFEARLHEAAARWFSAKGFQTQKKYPYILGEWEDWWQNIILPEVAAYVRSERERCQAESKPFPLHKFAHHGLSSQAMLFNLVGPLVVRQDLAPMREAFAEQGVPWPDGVVMAKFELEDRAVFNEDSGQPTSIDLVLQGSEGTAPLFIESKFVEREFGRCSVFAKGDCDGRNPSYNRNECYLHFLGRTYWDRLDAHGFLASPLFAGPICPLACYYQFFREALFALQKGGYFVLLYDERNPTFVCAGSDGRRGLLPFLLSHLPGGALAKVKHVTVQAVFASIMASGRHSDWTGEFARKYGLAN